MGLFLVTPINQPEKVVSSVKSLFAEDYYAIPSTNSLLVHYSGTTKELSDKLGLTTGENEATGVIVGFSNYYGRAPTDIWEWIKSRMEKD